MKKIFITIYIISFLIIGCSTKKYFNLPSITTNTEALIQLKSNKIKANVFFDYSKCLVNKNYILNSIDDIDDNRFNNLQSWIKQGEQNFYTHFNQNYGNKIINLVENNEKTQYTIYFDIYAIHFMNKKVIGKISTLIQIGGVYTIINNATKETIAIDYITCDGNVNRGIINDPTLDKQTIIMYKNLANIFAYQILQSK